MSLPAPLNNPNLFIGLVIFIVASVLLYLGRIPLSAWTTIVGVLLGYYFGYQYALMEARRRGG
jgi:hypothetical protein